MKFLYRVADDMPVTGLGVETFPPVPGESKKYFIMATTPTRIYQFIGGPTFEVDSPVHCLQPPPFFLSSLERCLLVQKAIFPNYETNPGFHELPGEIRHSELCFFGPSLGLAKSFAWLTGANSCAEQC